MVDERQFALVGMRLLDRREAARDGTKISGAGFFVPGASLAAKAQTAIQQQPRTKNEERCAMNSLTST
jgi:hypothetical protein